jgi:predicted membrane protein
MSVEQVVAQGAEHIAVHGLEWTTKELFTYPNEFIYWSIQIVMYPYMTGLVAGAFVLSSLYHVFGQQDLKNMARFSLVFSLALLPVAMMPLQFHLQQPLRGMNVMFTPHFTSAIAAFGIVFSTYAVIVISEIWFVYRKFFVDQIQILKDKEGGGDRLKYYLYLLISLGAFDTSDEAIAKDKKAVKILAAIGIIMSAIVSGIALCMLTYIIIMEFKKWGAIIAKGKGDESVHMIAGAELDVITKTSRYLLGFLIAAITLELLDLIFRGYTAMKSWDILRSVMYGKDFIHIFVLQYTLGNLVPFVLLLIPGLTIRRVFFALILVLFGVFMMRWNVVIGGQAFSLSFAGYMHYHLPIIPHNLETFREGLFGALTVAATPFVLFWIINKVTPSLEYK